MINSNPNSNTIINLQKENLLLREEIMILKEQLKSSEKHLQSMQAEFNNVKEKYYIEGYKQAANDNTINIKLSPATATASADIILKSPLKPCADNISFGAKPIYSYADEVMKLIEEERQKAKEYK